MMSSLTTKKENCTGLLQTRYRKFTKSIKVFLMLFLLTASVNQSLNAQCVEPNCLDISGPLRVCAGSGNVVYTAMSSCYADNIYTFGLVNSTFGTTNATIVSSTVNTVTINPGTLRGNYRVTVFAVSASCSSNNADAALEVAVNLIDLNLTQMPVSCFGQNSGSVTATFADLIFVTMAPTSDIIFS